MSLKIASVLLFLLFAVKLKAQSDTANIKSYADQVMVRLNLDTNIESYVFSENINNKRENEMVFSINNKIKTSLSIDYKIISATLSVTPRFIPGNNDNERKGNSSYTDFRFRFFPKSFIQTLYYKNVKGFYVENMKDLLPEWQEGKDPYMQFPDLRVQTFGGSTSYVLNKNFSMKSIYTQGEWQKNSRGSWIPFLDYDFTIFTNNVDGQRSKEIQYNIGANMGYSYNWVIGKKVNISPYLALGVGGKFSSYRDDLQNGSRVNTQYVTIRSAGGLHIGYNADRFLFGGKINFNDYTYSHKENQTVENSNVYGLIYIGFRFAPPKVIEKNYDKIKKKIPVL